MEARAASQAQNIGKFDMVSMICKHSGLVFEAENRRKTVHPTISHYTSHRDTITRHYAVRVIKQGKVEGWTTIEQFEEAIASALQPKAKPEAEVGALQSKPKPKPKLKSDVEARPDSRPKSDAGIDYDFEGAWVAQIVGLDPKFGYQRQFLDAAKQAGRSKYFQFPESGVVETCYKSAEGGSTRRFLLIENGAESKVLTRKEVDEMLVGAA